MVVTVQAGAAVSRRERARLVREVSESLAPFQPRVVRASVWVLRGDDGPGPDAPAPVRVRITVPLGPGGVARAEAAGAALASAAQAATRRIAELVGRRLRLEREELLQFLFLASAGPRWPSTPPRAVPRRRTGGRRPGRPHLTPSGRAPRAAA